MTGIAVPPRGKGISGLRVRPGGFGGKIELSPGDVVVFCGDQKHSSATRGAKTAIAYRAVVLLAGPDRVVVSTLH